MAEDLKTRLARAGEVASRVGSGAEPNNDGSTIYIQLKGKKIWFRGGTDVDKKQSVYDECKYDYLLLIDEKIFAKKICDENGCSYINFKTGEKFPNSYDKYGSEEDIIKEIRREFKLSTMEERLKNIFIDDQNLLKKDTDIKSKQIIFTGAPGTGKTYTAKKMTKIFCVMDGGLSYEEAKKIVGIIDLIEDKDSQDNFETAINKWNEVNQKNEENQYEVTDEKKEKIKKWHEALKENERIQFVQFHPSYDYSDFVEGLRPVVVEGQSSGFSMKYSEINKIKECRTEKGIFEGDIRSKSEGNPTFVRLDGIFKEFCRKAVEEKEKKYFFIIDEINRADLSKVFGELMYCLEEGYRGERNKVPTQYKNLRTYQVKDKFAEPLAKDCFKKGFYIPENVYIIGTMNDIDRSVEAFDFALRRRFKWIPVEVADEMDALDEMLQGENSGDDNATKIQQLKIRIKNLNYIIANDSKEKSLGEELGLTKAYHIGHAYFKDFNGDYDDIWKSRIEPLLESYCIGQEHTEFKNACEAAFKGPQGK